MSSPTVFITGVTGFIGGDVLYAITKAHPDWSISCLVRNSSKAATIKENYPNLKLVCGSLQDDEIIYNEAKQADITLHFANSADHISSAVAIRDGIAAKDRPGHWIHTSGTGILIFPDVDKGVYGEPSEEIWDDIRDIREINCIPDHALHRNVDKIVLAASEKNRNIKSAIVCPSYVYGTGRGPEKTKSTSLPMMIRLMLMRGRGFKVGLGHNLWSDVHVRDLSKLYVALVEAAAGGGKPVEWGWRGYFFAAAGSHQLGNLAASVTATACKLGFINSEEVDSLDATEVNRMFQYGAMMWGTNSRSRASRAKSQLDWVPNMPRIDAEEMLVEAVQAEWESV